MTLFSILKSALTLMLLIMLSSCTKDANISLPAIFSDNMVLQQNSLATFWGQASPGARITVKASWEAEEHAQADSEGTWQLRISTPEAGGPYIIKITGKNAEITLNEVLVGEVWLASGQSNMEMPLKGWPPNDLILDSEKTISEANYPGIRMFTVTKNTSATPLDNVTGQWHIASPETAGDFSATAFFFAQKLHNETGFPVGIIHSSWGGTPAEAWVSGKMLAIDKDFSDVVEQLKELGPQENAYSEWLKNHETIHIGRSATAVDPLVGLDIFDQWSSNPALDVSDWEVMNLPGYIESTEIGDFDGVVWFRKDIEIPESWADKNLVLSLGPIDDRDVTYFNGVKVGGMEEEGLWQAERIYTIPANLVASGKATIAVRMIDNQGGGGIYGSADLLRIYPETNNEDVIALAGEWHYKVVAELKGDKMYLFDPEKDDFAMRPSRTLIVGPNTPTALYNAMIAPLLPYTIKGAIWYQGESNVGRANQYMRLKSMLITDWRNSFQNDDMSFYFVQLAPWHYNNLNGISSANLREAQRRMASLPHAGMAVTLDIGDVNNIHPANKLDVGVRLARLALANDYNIDIPFSGPLPAEKSIENGKIILSFTHTEGGLVIKDGIPNQFEIAGDDNIFYPAKVEVGDDSIILNSDKVPNPVNVRYAYRNNSMASLFNNVGLPAPSFTTENEILD